MKRGGVGYHKPVFGIAILFFLMGSYSLRFFSSGSAATEAGVGKTSCAVVVAGQVPNPGLYFFPHAPTIAEVIAASADSSNCDRLRNAAADTVMPPGFSLWVQKNPQGIFVYLLPLDGKKRLLLGLPIPLNRATMDELICLPGIGPGIAGEIITYRSTHGPFTHLEEIKNVRGIGEKRFNLIKNYLTVTPEIIHNDYFSR